MKALKGNLKSNITKILSSRLFVGTGLISYSLYLWHYPIFAFARIKGDTFFQYDKFQWICLTIVLSIISYFLVEKPFRNKKFNFKKISFFLLTIGSVILIFNLLVFKYNGFIERLPKYLHYVILNSEDDLRKPKLPKNFFDEINKLNNSNMSITIFGDSHIERLNRVFNPYFSVNIDHYEWHYIGGCYFLPNSNLVFPVAVLFFLLLIVLMILVISGVSFTILSINGFKSLGLYPAVTKLTISSLVCTPILKTRYLKKPVCLTTS